MIDPLALFIMILAAWLVCQITMQRWNAHVLTLFGLVFVAIYAPIAALWITITCVEAVLLVLLLRRFERQSPWRKYGAYAVLLNFLFVDLHPMSLGLVVETLAISFSTIRIFMTAKQLLSSRKPVKARETYWILTAGFFLPALIVGPVFSGIDIQKASKSEQSERAEPRDYRLVLTGLILAILINPACGLAVEKLTGEEGLDWPLFVVAPILFVQLFTAFWGQSLIAEHTSRFFGFRLPQNFDAPWKAKDIKDFWARWHRSMAQFVMQYIFLPLNLRGVSPRIATIAAFLFMGLWHNLSLGYFIWGVSHGLLMAYWPKREFNPLLAKLLQILTWVVVIGLSYVANYGALA